MTLAKMLRFTAVAIVACAFAACSRFEGAFAFLRNPPEVSRLPGSYTLDVGKYSYGSLKQLGYSDLSAVIELKADGTYTALRIPDCCFYGEHGYFGGYFEASGTWSVEKSASVHVVQLHFTQTRREGKSDIKQPKLFGGCSLTLTKGDRSYGLAAPLFDGEFQYAYFAKTEKG